jgi:maltose phosphorylase
MENYLETDLWCVIENGFDPSRKIDVEKSFCLNNGLIKQYANFEEYYSGETILGSYTEGLDYSELTGSNWKNGFSDSNEIYINAPNWTPIIVRLNEEVLDLRTWEVENFKNILNMQQGYIERSFEAVSLKGHRIQVVVKRFLSQYEKEVGAISYTVKSLDYEGRISFAPIIDADFSNQYPKVNELDWNVLQTRTQKDVSHLWTQIQRMDFHICAALTYHFSKNNEMLNFIPTKIEKQKVAGFSIGTDVRVGDKVKLIKYVSLMSSANHPRQLLTSRACELALAAKQKGWNALFEEHASVWSEKWSQLNIDTQMSNQQDTIYKIFSSNKF